MLAWVRQGEKLAKNFDGEIWDKEKFARTISNLRRITRKKNPGLFLEDLVSICRDCGVALVIARTPKECPASGATKMLTSGNPLILISFRYLTDDQFWFTFFHEAAHVILHETNGTRLEIASSEEGDIEEEQANNFARDVLIPKDLYNELLTMRISTMSVLKFARKAGIAPGIVVGQLQYLNRIGHNKLNSLKRRYQWEDILPTL